MRSRAPDVERDASSDPTPIPSRLRAFLFSRSLILCSALPATQRRHPIRRSAADHLQTSRARVRKVKPARRSECDKPREHAQVDSKSQLIDLLDREALSSFARLQVVWVRLHFLALSALAVVREERAEQVAAVVLATRAARCTTDVSKERELADGQSISRRTVQSNRIFGIGEAMPGE